MITRLQIFDAEIEDIKKEFVTFTEGNSFNDFFHSDPEGGLWFRIDRKDEIRKNRIYLIKHEGNEAAYIYFDIDTKKFSDVKIFKTEDIIKGK